MREIRKSGSEGGGIETNRCFLPLSVSTVGVYWIANRNRMLPISTI